MAEMQQAGQSPTAAAQAAQAAAQAAADVAVRAANDAATQALQAAGVPSAGVDLSGYSAQQLSRMLNSLREQRADIAGRRSGIAETYERATGANREAIGTRLKIIDANIVVYESEIARVGRELAVKEASRAVTVQPSNRNPGGYVAEDDAVAMVFGFSFMSLLLGVFFTRRFMMRKHGRVAPSGQPHMLASNERLDRIEQAVDSIAIEVERVSENQRFMTRLMTETQLGDTIKDVRKSAELAKSAAESSG
jgi:hypothetical protein